jgi:hypothetical protein
LRSYYLPYNDQAHWALNFPSAATRRRRPL